MATHRKGDDRMNNPNQLNYAEKLRKHREENPTQKPDNSKGDKLCEIHGVKYKVKCPSCWSFAKMHCNACGFDGQFAWKKLRLVCPQCDKMLMETEYLQPIKVSA